MAGEGLAECHLVGVLEVRAHGQPAGQAGDPHLRRDRAQLFGDVQRRGLPGRWRGWWPGPLRGRRARVPSRVSSARRSADPRGRCRRSARAPRRGRGRRRDTRGCAPSGSRRWAPPRRRSPRARALRASGIPAACLIGEVEADLAQADSLLDLHDRGRERSRVLGRGAKDVEREPLRGPVADTGELSSTAP